MHSLALDLPAKFDFGYLEVPNTLVKHFQKKSLAEVLRILALHNYLPVPIF